MGKLQADDRIKVSPEQAILTAKALFTAAGTTPEVAEEVAKHLVEADQSGVESHGIVRVLQYTREMLDGTLNTGAKPEIKKSDSGRLTVDARGSIGIPAMRSARRAPNRLDCVRSTRR